MLVWHYDCKQACVLYRTCVCLCLVVMTKCPTKPLKIKVQSSLGLVVGGCSLPCAEAGSWPLCHRCTPAETWWWCSTSSLSIQSFGPEQYAALLHGLCLSSGLHFGLGLLQWRTEPGSLTSPFSPGWFLSVYHSNRKQPQAKVALPSSFSCRDSFIQTRKIYVHGDPRQSKWAIPPLLLDVV